MASARARTITLHIRGGRRQRREITGITGRFQGDADIAQERGVWCGEIGEPRNLAKRASSIAR